MYSVPVELVSFVPAIVAFYKIIPMNDLKLLHPGIAGITLLYSNESVFGYAIASLVFWSVIIFKITVLNVEKGYERWWSK